MQPLEMDSKRPDGRQPNQLRSLDSEVGLMTRADGSARFAHGKTEVLATVSGPADISASKEEPDRATIDVIWRPKQGSVSSIKVIQPMPTYATINRFACVCMLHASHHHPPHHSVHLS